MKKLTVSRIIADQLQIIRQMKFYPVCPECGTKQKHFVLEGNVYQCRECWTPWILV